MHRRDSHSSCLSWPTGHWLQCAFCHATERHTLRCRLLLGRTFRVRSKHSIEAFECFVVKFTDELPQPIEKLCDRRRHPCAHHDEDAAVIAVGVRKPMPVAPGAGRCLMLGRDLSNAVVTSASVFSLVTMLHDRVQHTNRLGQVAAEVRTFARTFCCERCRQKPFVAWPGMSDCSVHLGKLLWAHRSAAEPATPFLNSRPTCSSSLHLCVRNLPADTLVDSEPIIGNHWRRAIECQRWDRASAPPLPLPNGIIGGEQPAVSQAGPFRGNESVHIESFPALRNGPGQRVLFRELSSIM